MRYISHSGVILTTRAYKELKPRSCSTIKLTNKKLRMHILVFILREY